MIGAIVGDGARFATMSLWVMALALIAKGSVLIGEKEPVGTDPAAGVFCSVKVG